MGIIISILIGVAYLSFIILDGWPGQNQWRWHRSIGKIFQWMWQTYVLRFLLVYIGISLFLAGISISGALLHNVWLTSAPLALVGFLVFLPVNTLQWFPRMIAHGIDSRRGTEFWKYGNFSQDASESSEQNVRWTVQSFMGWLFWLYVILFWITVLPPWKGDNAALSFLLVLVFAAFAFLCRFLGTQRIVAKIIAMIAVLFMFTIHVAKVYPDASPTLTSGVDRVLAWNRYRDSSRNLNTAVDNQKSDYKEDATRRVEKIREGKLKKGYIPLDSNAEPIDVSNPEPKVKIENTLTVDQLPPKLQSYFPKTTKDEFYQLRIPDDRGYYSDNSTVVYTTTDAIQGIILIPQEPKIIDPNEKEKPQKSQQTIAVAVSKENRGTYCSPPENSPLKLGECITVIGPTKTSPDKKKQWQWGFADKSKKTLVTGYPINTTQKVPLQAEKVLIQLKDSADWTRQGVQFYVIRN